MDRSLCESQSSPGSRPSCSQSETACRCMLARVPPRAVKVEGYHPRTEGQRMMDVWYLSTVKRPASIPHAAEAPMSLSALAELSEPGPRGGVSGIRGRSISCLYSNTALAQQPRPIPQKLLRSFTTNDSVS